MQKMHLLQFLKLKLDFSFSTRNSPILESSSRNLLQPEVRVLIPEEEARSVGAGRHESHLGVQRSKPVPPATRLPCSCCYCCTSF